MVLKLPPPNFSWFVSEHVVDVYVYKKLRQVRSGEEKRLGTSVCSIIAAQYPHSLCSSKSSLEPVVNSLNWIEPSLFANPVGYLCPTRGCEMFEKVSISVERTTSLDALTTRRS